MGCVQSAEEKASAERNAELERQIKKDAETMIGEVKMLLLGAGESGKSTILKQMKLIHSNGYTEDEKKFHREIVYSNIIQSMKQILDGMRLLNIRLGSSDHEKHAVLVQDFNFNVDMKGIPSELIVAIRNLWKDEGVKKCYSRSREYQLNDSAKYFFDSLDRIAHPNYMPTDQDILRARVKTTSIIETAFHIGEVTYRLFDVGGQRSERKKWIHCFEGVTAILFLVAISEYDQVLYEDRNVNRLQESLALFDSVCNSKWFAKTSMILFLNKKDLFAEKLQRSPLEKYCSDYEGTSDYDEAAAYMARKFNSLNQSTEKQIYTHFTCATDTDQIKVVMEAVYDTVLQANLRNCGLV